MFERLIEVLDKETLRVLLIIASGVFLLTFFIGSIWLLSAYVHGPYHYNPNTKPEWTCIAGHDETYTSDGEVYTTRVCDNWAQERPGFTPTPNPTETAVPKGSS